MTTAARKKSPPPPQLPALPDDLAGWRWGAHPAGTGEYTLIAPDGAYSTRYYLKLDERPFAEARRYLNSLPKAEKPSPADTAIRQLEDRAYTVITDYNDHPEYSILHARWGTDALHCVGIDDFLATTAAILLAPADASTADIVARLEDEPAPAEEPQLPADVAEQVQGVGLIATWQPDGAGWTLTWPGESTEGLFVYNAEEARNWLAEEQLWQDKPIRSLAGWEIARNEAGKWRFFSRSLGMGTAWHNAPADAAYSPLVLAANAEEPAADQALTVIAPEPAAIEGVVMMDADEARAAVAEIKGHLESARLRLVELEEREGWRALGYASWRECAAAEFGQSQAYLYRQLAAAKIERDLDSPMGEIPERQLRPLGKLDTPEERKQAWQRAGELAGDAPRTAKHVEQAVAEQRPPLAPLMSSKSDEWYTPPHIVRLVLTLWETDAVDLDPCSPTKNPAEAPVPARLYYTKADEGLGQVWAGRVYMNPPYGEVIGAWVERLLGAYLAGEIEEAVALLPARTDTAWFKPLHAYPRCFVRGRIAFGGPGGQGIGAPFPSVIVYLGSDLEGFRRVFGGIGEISIDVEPQLLEEPDDEAPPAALLGELPTVAVAATDDDEPDPLSLDPALQVALRAAGIAVLEVIWNEYWNEWTYTISFLNDKRAGSLYKNIDGLRLLAAAYQPAPAGIGEAPPSDPAWKQTAAAQLSDAIAAIVNGERRTALTGALGGLLMLLIEQEHDQLIAECKALVEASASAADAYPTFAAAARVLARALPRKEPITNEAG